MNQNETPEIDLPDKLPYKFKRCSGGTLIIACGALAKEVVSVIEHNRLDHVDVQCLPAKLHHRPSLIPGALEKVLEKNKLLYEAIYVMYGDCGTAGGIDEVIEEYGVERIGGPHCFSFYEGNQSFLDSDEDVTSFFLTDFFCQHFEKFMWQALGLDRHESMCEFVFGNYKKLVYIAQTDDDSLKQKAADIAKRLDLEFEYRFRAYGDLGIFISTL